MVHTQSFYKWLGFTAFLQFESTIEQILLPPFVMVLEHRYVFSSQLSLNGLTLFNGGHPRA